MANKTSNTQLNTGLVKKLITNVRRIRYSPNIEKVRLVKDDNGNIYAITFSLSNQQLTIYNALTLEYCGRAKINVSENDGHKKAEIMQIEIDKQLRKRGIGTQVMQFAEHNFKELGIEEISLYASQSKANTRNSILRKWYKKLGYTQLTFSHHEPNLFVKKQLKANPATYKTLANIVPCTIQAELKNKRFTLKRLSHNNKFKTFDMELD